MILAYETSTNICSVSFQDSEGNITERRIQGRSVHSDNVFLFTKVFMNDYGFKIEDLDAVIISNGPGSYTGLRIAASAIKGLLFGTEVPLYAASTLASFTMETPIKDHTIHSIIDARRTHVYHQAFELNNKLIAKTEAKILDISDFTDQINTGDCIVGNGTERLDKERLKGVTICDDRCITANSLFKLYQLPNFKEFCVKTRPEELNPNYISSSQVNNSNRE